MSSAPSSLVTDLQAPQVLCKCLAMGREVLARESAWVQDSYAATVQQAWVYGTDGFAAGGGQLLATSLAKSERASGTGPTWSEPLAFCFRESLVAFEAT